MFKGHLPNKSEQERLEAEYQIVADKRVGETSLFRKPPGCNERWN